jgi:hypothetical protein
MIDSDGRLFGRFNIIDTLVALFVLGLIPVAYATYLLFRPATPSIDSVERVEITREERRVASGSVLLAKLKVRGNGFSPMLRAMLGDVPTLGFVFENPNSADIIVGAMSPGTYDLVLLDGVQEVARASKAFTVEATPVSHIRVAGYLTDLTADRATSFSVGSGFPEGSQQVRVLALGIPQPARTRLRVGDRVTDVPTPDRLERAAVLSLRCDPRAGPEPCTFAGIPLIGDAPQLLLPGPAGPTGFVVTDVFPDVPPRRVEAVLRASGGSELRRIAAGDRDNLLDERAASVTAVGGYREAAGMGSIEITISLGVDDSREGWRYRGQLIRPGAAATFALPGAMVQGILERVTEQSGGDHD